MPHNFQENLQNLERVLKSLLSSVVEGQDANVVGFNNGKSNSSGFRFDSHNGSPLGRVLFSYEFLDDLSPSEAEAFLRRNFRIFPRKTEQFFQFRAGHPTVEERPW